MSSTTSTVQPVTTYGFVDKSESLGSDVRAVLDGLSTIQLVGVCVIVFQYIISLPWILVCVWRLRTSMRDEGINSFIRRRHPHATFVLIVFIAIYLCVYYPISIFCWTIYNDTCPSTLNDMVIMGFEETILLVLLQLILYRFWMLFYDHKHALASVDINWLQYIPSMIGGAFESDLNVRDEPLNLEMQKTGAKGVNSTRSRAPLPPEDPDDGSVSESEWGKDLFIRNNFFLKNERSFGNSWYLFKLNALTCLLLLALILLACWQLDWNYDVWFYTWFACYAVIFVVILIIAFRGVSPIYDRFYVQRELFYLLCIIFVCLALDFILAHLKFVVEEILRIQSGKKFAFWYHSQLFQCVPETLSMLVIVYVCSFYVVSLAVRAQESDQFMEAVLKTRGVKMSARWRLKRKRLKKKAKRAWKRATCRGGFRIRDSRSRRTNYELGAREDSNDSDSDGVDDFVAGGDINALNEIENSQDAMGSNGVVMIDLPQLLENYDGFIAFARHLVTELAVGNLLFIVECGILMTYTSPDVQMQPIGKSDASSRSPYDSDSEDTDCELAAEDVMSTDRIRSKKKSKFNRTGKRNFDEREEKVDVAVGRNVYGKDYEHPSDYNVNNIGLSITIRDVYDETDGDIRVVLPVILAKRFKNYVGKNKGMFGGATNGMGMDHFSGNFVMQSAMKQIYNKYICVENSKLSTDISDEIKHKITMLMHEWKNDDSLTAETKLVEALDEAMAQCWTALEDCYIHFKLQPEYPIIAKRLAGNPHEPSLR